jgi:hypothetical protein
MKPILILALLLTSLATQAWAQTDSSQSSSQTPWHPTMNGESGSLAFLPEAQKVNLLSGGFTVAGTFDDNAFSTFDDHVGSFGYTVTPNLSITEMRPQTLFTLNYSPSFLWSQRSPVEYQWGQNADSTFQARLTERATVRMHENFVDESTAFSQLNEVPLLTGGVVLNQSNQSVITPLTTARTNASTVDLMDQVGEDTSVGATGTFNKLDFEDTGPSAAPLFDNQSWSGQVFYSHHLSPQHTAGVTFTFQKFSTFGQILEHTQSENAILYYRVDFRPGVFASVFAGPDHSIANDQYQLTLAPGVSLPVSQTNSMWLLDEGITFGWQGQRTSARVNLVHYVTDGGGLAGAVRLYSGQFDVRTQLSKTLTAELALNYGDDDPLSHAYGNTTFAGYGGTIGLERMLGDHFTVGMKYGRYSQKFEQFPATTPTFPADHNQGWITITYRFTRPLGG